MATIDRKLADKGYRHREIAGHPLKPETLMMGYGYDPRLSEGAVKCPIFLTSTFAFRSAEEGKAFFEIAYGLRTTLICRFSRTGSRSGTAPRRASRSRPGCRPFPRPC
jgi:cystathionine beta-lyase/cystathionine gamma-synthase